MSLINWKKNYDPFREFLDADDRLMGVTLFPGLDRSVNLAKGIFRPAVDVSEDKNNIYVHADLPGLKQEEIEVTVEEDILTLKGERKFESEKEEKNYHRSERFYGSFERSLQLGVPIEKEKIKASYKNGVLDITLPKSEKIKPKQIKVDVN